jgi:hypothetical protein
MFSLNELHVMLRDQRQACRAYKALLPEIVAKAASELGASQQRSASLEDELDSWLDARSAPLRRADRRYWRAIIDELRTLRSSNDLMPEGALV